jgi:Fe-S-cluster formation regulator IscX/YfhJ
METDEPARSNTETRKMILEITQLIWLTTPKGQAIAKFLIDYGPEADLQWVCFIQETREIWTFSNFDVRVETNVTLGRK